MGVRTDEGIILYERRRQFKDGQKDYTAKSLPLKYEGLASIKIRFDKQHKVFIVTEGYKEGQVNECELDEIFNEFYGRERKTLPATPSHPELLKE